MRKDFLASGIALIVIAVILLSITYNSDILYKPQKINLDIPIASHKKSSSDLKKGDKIIFSFKLDREIKEVFICNESAFQQWKNENPIKPLQSVKNTKEGTIKFEIPYDDKWHFVFNNRQGNYNINADYEIKVLSYSLYQTIFYLSIAMLIAGIVLVPVAFYRKREENQYPPYYQREYYQKNYPYYSQPYAQSKYQMQQQYQQYKRVSCARCGAMIDVRTNSFPAEVFCNYCGHKQIVF